jgi:hypothetical protein
MPDDYQYNFNGTSVHDMIKVSEEVRKKISSYPQDLTANQKAELRVLQELKDALTEYIYQQTIIMDQQQNQQQ